MNVLFDSTNFDSSTIIKIKKIFVYYFRVKDQVREEFQRKHGVGPNSYFTYVILSLGKS